MIAQLTMDTNAVVAPIRGDEEPAPPRPASEVLLPLPVADELLAGQTLRVTEARLNDRLPKSPSFAARSSMPDTSHWQPYVPSAKQPAPPAVPAKLAARPEKPS